DEATIDEASAHPKSLAMVNVETVHTRWVNDINAFLQAADAQVQEKFDTPIADWMQDSEREKDEAKGGRWKPKGTTEGGWVIEIRGYTDHDKGRTFVRQALLRNLQRIDGFAKDDAKVGRFIVGVPDPVKGKVSYPFVYNVWQTVDPQPGVFQYIRPSYLDGLVGGGGNAPTGGEGTVLVGPPSGMPMSGLPGGPTSATIGGGTSPGG